MKRFLLGLAIATVSVSPAFCEEHEFDLDKELEHMELQREQAEFGFEQEMRELELEKRHIELDMLRREIDAPGKHHEYGDKDELEFLFLLCGIVHILMAVWVYQDVRKKDNGHGIWIIITLLFGFFGASVYALIRMGDCSPKQEE